jgi:acyl-CoA reductase-like NAD-dependent aldehyde dehydrogenase
VYKFTIYWLHFWRQIFREIFGPILPIIPVDDINEAIRIICDRPIPLVIYVFTENEVATDLCKHNPS